MPDVTVDIKTGHQQVMNTLEQRVVDDPRRAGRLAREAVAHRRAVEVAQHRERRVGVLAAPVPDVAERVLDDARDHL